MRVLGGGLRRIIHNKKQVSPTCCSMGSSTVRTTDVNYTHTLFGNPTVHVQSPTLMPLYGEKKNKIDFVFTSVRGRTQWEFLFNNTIHNITVVNWFLYLVLRCPPLLFSPHSWVLEASHCLVNLVPFWGRTSTAAWRTSTTTESISSTWQRGVSHRYTAWWVQSFIFRFKGTSFLWGLCCGRASKSELFRTLITIY